MSVAAIPAPQRAMVRAFAWALIGAIYAPLFVTLNALLAPQLGPGSLVVAAATAGAVGAAFYGARQVALVAALIGVAAAALVLSLPLAQRASWMVAALAGGSGLGIGLLVRFPARCTLRVPVKVLVGGVTGALCGGVLLALAVVAGLVLSPPVVVAFLVSVNGVLYVAALPALARRAPVGNGRFCNLIEAVVMALIAVIVAGSVWGFTGLLADGTPGVLVTALQASAAVIPPAMIAGMLAGAITGALLELFDFAWTDEV